MQQQMNSGRLLDSGTKQWKKLYPVADSDAENASDGSDSDGW